MKIDLTQACYCGLPKAFDACCHIFHQGTPAPTPETLMRSRFSAFATANVAYIIKTQADQLNQGIDPQAFKEELQKQKWIKLEVLQSQDNTVTFQASMLNHDILYTLKEHSLFDTKDDQWIYTQAIEHEDSEYKMSRNEPCPCGSGKKYKQCCQKG